MILGIYSYFVFKRSKINKIFIYIWTVLLLGNLAFILIELKFDSIFFLYQYNMLYNIDNNPIIFKQVYGQ